MNTVTVDLTPSYPVVIGAEIPIGEVLAAHVSPGPCVIVTDSNVGPLHLADACGSLESAGWEVLDNLQFIAGEESKSLKVYSELLGRVARTGLGRDGTIFALGGGVVGDLVGFVAASYMRGVRLVMLPTTLLSMVDSSVGGKVGLDLPEGKNLVGAFHQPEAVVADIARLETLPEREISNGLAELVKMGLLAGGEYFRDLDAISAARSGDSGPLVKLIEHAVRYKASVVERDEREGGLRSVLNYGHTIGHGLEAASGYRLSHGEAISLGMVCAAKIGAKHTGFDLMERQRELLLACGLPVTQTGFDAGAVLAAMSRDKKRAAEDGARMHRFVLLEEIGRPVWGVSVSEPEVIEALETLKGAG
ncbi:3-dehydroquinate synthase [Rubrobacter indicoceani]|uniref:3-dehydroquinate synthase n=1 Tax=Rubrobacter indicoceani TaxID=2051957 RepID=UPI000E5C2793|nr:3-dehydroquinate synthase [Rubrobacter indicoceani]